LSLALAMGMSQYLVCFNANTDYHSFIASTIPAWQAECLKTQRRGTLLLVSFGGCIALGLTLSYWLSFGFSYVETSSVAWRFPIAFSGVFILPALLLVSFLPESPRYLLLCGKEREALNVLSALEELPADHEDVRREVLLIKNTVLKLAGGSSISAMFTMGKERNLHRVLLAGKSCIFPYFHPRD
jgi:MFS family permease